MKAQKMNRGFTLIELLIVISIISILSIGIFIPYNLYSNIAKVRLSREIITQAISEARNSSAGLVDIGTLKSQNIAIYIEKGEPGLSIYSYPYDYTGAIEVNGSANRLRYVNLENGVNINGIKDDNSAPLDRIILYFKAPDGIMETYKDSSSTGSVKDIILGLGDAQTGVLSKIVELNK